MPFVPGERVSFFAATGLRDRAGWAWLVAENIVPLCLPCHTDVTFSESLPSKLLCMALTDAEYAYAVERGGEAFFERCYGIRYTRP